MRALFALSLLSAALLPACEPTGPDKPGAGEQSSSSLTLSAKALEIGPVPAGERSTATVMVRNVTDGLVQVDLPWIEGDGAFTLLDPAGAFELRPGSVRELTVAYTPGGGVAQGALWVQAAGEVPLQVSLVGSGEGPRLVAGADQDFGSVPLGCRVREVRELSNLGTDPLVIESLAVSGEGYTLVDPPATPLTLQPGELIELQLEVEGLREGLMPGALQLRAAAPVGAVELAQVAVGDAQEVCVVMPEGGEVRQPLSTTVELRVADVSFLLDTTGSMAGLIAGVQADYATIADELSTRLDSPTWGVGSFEDYHYSGMASGDDLPFTLELQQTDDLAATQTALLGLSLGNGDDVTESSPEALLQAATGIGYDQDCNGTYDSLTDVPPFLPLASDAFGGSAAGAGDAAGLGVIGGMGFREGVLPVFILGTDAPMRDLSAGDRVPGGCPGDATVADATAAVAALGGRFIGVNVGGTSTASQLEAIAVGTDSNLLFGPAVVDWSGDSGFAELVTDAVIELVDGLAFEAVWLELDIPPEAGILGRVSPESLPATASGALGEFEITLEDAGGEPGSHRVTARMMGMLDGRPVILREHRLVVERR
jgi:hypothetical protein